MSSTFIPLNDLSGYLDSRLWTICSAAVLADTKHANLIQPAIENINLWVGTVQEITTTIEYHGLSGVLYSLAQQHEISLPLRSSMVIKASSVKHAQRWQAITRVLQEIQNDIAPATRFCLLKGSALSSQIYTEAYHRAMSDIDIMCAPKDAQNLQQQCIKAGFNGFDGASLDLKHHHLPAISKQLGQHQINLEIHTHALSFDLNQQLNWSDVDAQLRTITIEQQDYLSLQHEQMLLQLCVHAFARDQVIKLSNIVDIFRYAIIFDDELDWEKIRNSHPEILLTLRYSRLLLDLPEQVLPQVKPIPNIQKKKISGLGESMLPLRELSNPQMALLQRLKLLFFPSKWWQHIFYAIEPADSNQSQMQKLGIPALWVRYVIHPLKVLGWITSKTVVQRVMSVFSVKQTKNINK